MPDPKHLLKKWFRRDREPDPVNPTAPPNDSAITGESIIDNLTLALSLAQQVTSILQVAPFIAPAAALLSEIVDSYKETKDAHEKRDALATRIANLTGDICAAVLRMEATNHSDLIGCLKPDLEKYAVLIGRASEFVDKYDKQGKIVRWAARSQLSDEMHQLNQELDSFGARFRTNRLVDLAINQSANARTMDKIHDMAVAEKLEKWLRNPPPTSQKHHDTEKLFKTGTGRWLFDRDKFIEWQDNAGFLWIEGPSGAGKSVLSSTVISTLVAEKKLYKAMEDSTPPPAVAFFYYDFRNKETQTAEIALRRIVLQLSAQSPHPYRVLDEHYNLSHGQTLPSFQDLQMILEQLLREIGRIYIVLDALDECDVGEFDQLVDLVSTLRAWSETPLHMLFTSQPRPVFTEGFEGIPCIPLGFYLTEDDIRFFVADEIKTKSKYKQWRGQDQIVDRIAQKSKGMFRMAACLLLELGRCEWEEELEEIFENLPNDLFAIYERFLEKIAPKHWVYVEATLRWIMFSNERITLAQLADAIAFDFSNTEQYIYKPDRRKATAIFDWLEGLVIEVKSARSEETRVELAHASVQDYLLSNQFYAKFGCGLDESRSHTFIAQTCISYLLYFGDHPLEEGTIPNYVDRLDGKTIPNYPLAVYAAEQWCGHLLHCHDRAILFDVAMRLLEDGSDQYKAFCYLRPGGIESEPAGSPLYLCCQIGYLEAVEGLLANHADINRGFEDRTPLMVASSEGHKDIVCLLLGNGADINLRSHCHSSALATTSLDGHMEIVGLLLEHGADVNLWYEGNGNALQIASRWGHTEIVRILLENGADPNLQTGNSEGSALTRASGGGHLQIVHLLLENGADVNQPGGRYGSALSAASADGDIEIVRLLLENGADISTQGGCALEEASKRGRDDIVALLQRKGVVLTSEERTSE